ncbi:hypothetical protein ACHHYP_08194 [Achlya hypogyna]|uniref:VOC domain-containing protein n=1 Tax=Achlya hypogyna TaxID=1202772 RepID=A0A1V9YPN3_ACHHY|nr:hypothetical protein ACHHYP_08194 [Achlya hypogyna]
MRATHVLRSVTRGILAAAPPSLDHVCLVVKDVPKSIKFYEHVLGATHLYKDDPNFGEDPAFLKVGSAQIALLPLAATHKPIEDHNGAHFALSCSSTTDFERIKASLGGDLKEIGANDEVDFQDYGRQLSLFFSDLDGNIVEITHWKRK